MKGYLLDTNIPSEMTRPRPESRVSRWLDDADDDQLYFSVVSLGEILKGVTVLRFHCGDCPGTRSHRCYAERERLRRVKVSDQTRRLYEKRDRTLDNDLDAPTLPVEAWDNASIGKYYRSSRLSSRSGSTTKYWIG